jgi:hypothetical protein
MDNIEYHKDTKRISKSGLDLIAKSPYHYWYEKINPNRIYRQQTDEMILGSALHTIVFEHHKFDLEYAIAPDVNRRTNKGKQELSEFQQATGNRTLLKPSEYETIVAMKKAIWENPAVQVLLSHGIAEHTLDWQEPMTGALCKIRPDWLSNTGFICDLKSTEDASEAAFARTVVNYRYDVQGGFYVDGVTAATGVVPKGFIFIVVEKKPPFMTALYCLSERDLDLGRQKYLKDLNTYQECLKTGIWQGYSQGVKELKLPDWAYPKAPETLI